MASFFLHQFCYTTNEKVIKFFYLIPVEVDRKKFFIIIIAFPENLRDLLFSIRFFIKSLHLQLIYLVEASSLPCQAPKKSLANFCLLLPQYAPYLNFFSSIDHLTSYLPLITILFTFSVVGDMQHDFWIQVQNIQHIWFGFRHHHPHHLFSGSGTHWRIIHL